jgi:hypothetical protein
MGVVGVTSIIASVWCLKVALFLDDPDQLLGFNQMVRLSGNGVSAKIDMATEVAVP